MEHLEFFGLRGDPFRGCPDTGFYIDTDSHRDAGRRLARALCQGKGFSQLIGAPGSGKSVLVRHLLDTLGERDFDSRILAILPAAAGRCSVLKRLARQVGLASTSDAPGELLRELYEALVECAEAGRPLRLVIDDAHWLDSEGLDEVASLLRLEWQERHLVPMLLVGPPELSSNLAAHGGFTERTEVYVPLRVLDLQNVGLYLSKRLDSVGGDANLFSPEVIAAFCECSGGRARLLQTLADNVLYEACLEGRREIRVSDVEEAAAGHRSFEDESPPRAESLGSAGWLNEEPAAVAMDSVVDVAVGGALASECPIALLVDEEEGRELELELELAELPDPTPSPAPRQSAEGECTNSEATNSIDSAFFETELPEATDTDGLPLLLSEEELAGADLRGVDGERVLSE